MHTVFFFFLAAQYLQHCMGFLLVVMSGSCSVAVVHGPLIVVAASAAQNSLWGTRASAVTAPGL